MPHTLAAVNKTCLLKWTKETFYSESSWKHGFYTRISKAGLMFTEVYIQIVSIYFFLPTMNYTSQVTLRPNFIFSNETFQFIFFYRRFEEL